MKVEINNLIWEIEEVETRDVNLLEGENSCYGTCHYYKNVIYLDKSLTEFHKKRVLAHELTHAYIFSYLLTKQEKYSEEEMCEFVALYGNDIWNQVTDYFFKKEIEEEKAKNRKDLK